MKTLRVRGELVRIGGHEQDVADGEEAIVFSVGADAARKIAPALRRPAEVSVLWDDAAPPPSTLALREAICPLCQAPVFLATVSAPALMRVYVSREQHDRVAEYDDGHLAILPSYRLHAEVCPNWEGDRDWRTGCR